MRFRWVAIAGGRSWPLLRARLRRGGNPATIDTFLLVDTGADGTLLPLQMARLLGFGEEDLTSEVSRSVAGETMLRVPRSLHQSEIEIGGKWIALPSLKFAEHTYPLLGRDVIFANFDLRMTSDEFELRPRRRPRSGKSAAE
jgi:hypothetical protein